MELEYLISDVKNDRMRIIDPIVQDKKLSLEHIDRGHAGIKFS